MKKEDGTVCVMIRIPKDLHERLKAEAEQEYRSVNGQANILLQKALVALAEKAPA